MNLPDHPLDQAGNAAVFTAGLADKSPNPRPPAPRLQILLVEDHEDTAAVLTRLLQKAGHFVVHAPTLARALASASTAFPGGRMDLVISDVGLPDGTGLELMRRLSSSGPLPGIALSGYGMDFDIEQSKKAGFARHLTKPITTPLLFKAIAELTAVR